MVYSIVAVVHSTDNSRVVELPLALVLVLQLVYNMVLVPVCSMAVALVDSSKFE